MLWVICWMLVGWGHSASLRTGIYLHVLHAACVLGALGEGGGSVAPRRYAPRLPRAAGRQLHTLRGLQYRCHTVGFDRQVATPLGCNVNIQR